MPMMQRLIALMVILLGSGLALCQVPFQDAPKDEALRDSMIDLAMDLVRSPAVGSRSPSPSDYQRLAELTAWSGHVDHVHYLATNHLRAEDRAHMLGALTLSLIEQGDHDAAMAVARLAGQDNEMIPNGPLRGDADKSAAGALAAVGLEQEALAYLKRDHANPGSGEPTDVQAILDSLRGARVAALQAFGDRDSADAAWAQLESQPGVQASPNLIQTRAQRLAFDGDHAQALQILEGVPVRSFTQTDIARLRIWREVRAHGWSRPEMFATMQGDPYADIAMAHAGKARETWLALVEAERQPDYGTRWRMTPAMARRYILHAAASTGDLDFVERLAREQNWKQPIGERVSAMIAAAYQVGGRTPPPGLDFAMRKEFVPLVSARATELLARAGKKDEAHARLDAALTAIRERDTLVARTALLEAALITGDPGLIDRAADAVVEKLYRGAHAATEDNTAVVRILQAGHGAKLASLIRSMDRRPVLQLRFATHCARIAHGVAVPIEDFPMPSLEQSTIFRPTPVTLGSTRWVVPARDEPSN